MKTIYKSPEGKERILGQYEEYLTQFDSLIKRDYVKNKIWEHACTGNGEGKRKAFIYFSGR